MQQVTQLSAVVVMATKGDKDIAASSQVQYDFLVNRGKFVKASRFSGHLDQRTVFSCEIYKVHLGN